MSEDSQLREAVRFMVKMVIVAIVIILLLELAGCEDRSVIIHTNGSRIEAATSGPIGSCVTVTVDNATFPTLVLVPMPIPYQVTAEKQP